MKLGSKWGRRLAAVLIPSVLLVGLFVQSAEASTVVTTGDMLMGQFPSGDVAKDKINVEQTGSGALRVNSTSWCDNASGAAVNCDLIEGTDGVLYLVSVFGTPPPCSPTSCSGGQIEWLNDSYLDAATVHSKRFESPVGGGYSCPGNPLTLLHYRGKHNNIYMVSRFFEPMSAQKDRTTPYGGNILAC